MKMRNRIRHPDAAFAILGKLARGAHQLGDAGSKGEALPFDELIWTRFIVPLNQFGFVIKEVEMGRASRHVQINHPFDLGFQRRLLRAPRVYHRTGCSASFASQDAGQRDRTEAKLARSFKEISGGTSL